MKKPTGFIFYQGPSVLDGKPIIGIATLKSKNEKTGNLVQTWILPEGVSPVEAVKTGKDASVCGNCPQRQSVGGACYVNVGQAPNNIWNAYKAGNYPVANAFDMETLLAGRKLRIGSYGDPAAIPFET